MLSRQALLSVLLLLCSLLYARAENIIGTLAEEPYAFYFSTGNRIDADLPFSIETGTLWQAANGARYVALRKGEMIVPARGAGSISVPAAALAGTSVWLPRQKVQPLATREPRLEPLLAYLSTRNDVPRRTSQLVVLALLEDLNFAAWQQSAANANTPSTTSESAAAAQTRETATALDALSILREIAPRQDFALAADPALKLRALHDPALRAKALQLYGLSIPGDPPAVGAIPSVGQLMHTTPGDNCPVCRLRQEMRPREDAP